MSGLRSLRSRVALAAIAATAIVVVVSAATLIATAGQDERRDLDSQLERRAQGFARPPLPPFGGPPGEELLSGSDEVVRVLRGRGVMAELGEGPPSGELPLPEGAGFETVEVHGQSWRSYAFSPPRLPVAVQVATSLEPLERRVAARRREIVLVGVAALAVAGALGAAFGGVALRPLARLRQAAARVGNTRDLGARVPEVSGPDEVKALARSLNDMLARLESSSHATEAALESSRRFAADAGHELRTPLTGLRANLDALERNPDLPLEQRQALLREVVAEQERIVHLLEGLQALARGEAAESLPRESVEVADLVDQAVYEARRRHPGVEYALDERAEAATVHGWPGGLRLIVDNLLDNAALHGRPAGGHVNVTLERDASTLLLRVDDDGPGLSEPDRERLLEPFARGATTAPGTGLGLAIVAQQVALHGGVLRLDGSELGGLAVEVLLPLEGWRRGPSPAPEWLDSRP
jgi:signal transduction histidine kinase